MSDQLSGVLCNSGEVSLWHRMQLQHGFPLEVMLNVTNSCPLSCPHCYVCQTGTIDEMSLEEYRSLLEDLAGLGVLKVTITGGEPGLRSDFLSIVGMAATLRFVVVVKSSAFLFYREDVQRLWDLGCSELCVSFYSASPKAHDEFVGRQGAWAKAVQALQGFSKAGGISRASLVAMDWNVEDLGKTVEFCKKNGWSITIDPRIIHKNDGGEGPVSFQSTGEKLEMALELMGVSGTPETKSSLSDPICSAGISGAYVTPTGEVWACPNMPMSFGNVRDQGFESVWLNSTERKSVVENVWANSSKCSNCNVRSFCERCPGEAYQEHGNIHEPSASDCLLAKARYRRFLENS